jgi:acyl carrier protein
MTEDPQTKTEAEIRDWLIARIADRVGTSPRMVDPTKPFTVLGVDSTEAVVISGELQDWLGRRVPPTIVWDHPSIDAVAKHLASNS